MRTVFAAALCFILGACATFGGGTPDPYGTYDFLSLNGQALPVEGLIEGWCEVRPDGTDSCTMTLDGMDEPYVGTSPSSVGEFKDGCFPYESTDEDGNLWTGSICGGVLTAKEGQNTVVMHKRH